MSRSDARFEYKANLARTDFDLSQRLGFTCAPGMELPVWFDFASPGDSFYISHDMPLLRSDNLARPAMIDVKVHYETFFVPMQMLLQPFENCMFSLKNFQSTNFAGRTLTNGAFPLFDYSGYVTDILTNHMTDNIHAEAFRLADLLGLCPDVFTSSSATYQNKYAPSFFPWQLLAYHTIWQYYFRLDDKTQFDASCCNWDTHYGSSSAVGATLTQFMGIHQRPWDFDYYVSMYRSPIVSDTNMQAMMGERRFELSGQAVIGHGATAAGQASDNAAIQNFTSRLDSYNAQGFQVAVNTAQIRQLFASEKLAMITGRTRKNYDSQVLAHHGES